MPLDLVARAAAVVQHLGQFDVWMPGFAAATVDPAPSLVTMLTPPAEGSSTYAILTVRRAARITGRILLDPATADLLEATAVQQQGASLPAYVDPVHELQRRPATAAIGHALTAGHWPLVWKYCLQSASRFRPFWHVVVAGHAPLYVRVDGVVFTELTSVDR